MGKERKIKISMDSVQRGGKTVSVFNIGSKEIGSIEPDGSKFKAYVAGTDNAQLFKTEDEAVNYVIATYHLHQA